MTTITYPAGKTSNKIQRGEPVTRQMRKLASRISNGISKCVTIENDAIFNDPNWPYMWKHKR